AVLAVMSGSPRGLFAVERPGPARRADELAQLRVSIDGLEVDQPPTIDERGAEPQRRAQVPGERLVVVSVPVHPLASREVPDDAELHRSLELRREVEEGSRQHSEGIGATGTRERRDRAGQL